MRQIASVVEGEGEEAALPLLIRRVLTHLRLEASVQVLKPLREKRGTLLRPGELERYAQLAFSKAKGDARVLLLVDADDDCAAELGPSLQSRLDRVAPGGAVLAVRQYENWLLGDATSLGQDSRFRDSINPPGAPETVPTPKQWLTARRTDQRSYRPKLDQARLTELIDLDVVRQRCPSFDKFWREVERLATD